MLIGDQVVDIKVSTMDEQAESFFDLGQAVAESASSVISLLTASSEQLLIENVQKQFMRGDWAVIALDSIMGLFGAPVLTGWEKRVTRIIIRMLGNYSVHNYLAAMEQTIKLFDLLDVEYRKMVFNFLKSLKYSVPRECPNVRIFISHFKKFLKRPRNGGHPHPRARETLEEFLRGEGGMLLKTALR